MRSIMKPAQFCNNIDDAIRIGDKFYWDVPSCNEGRSGGERCPKCKKWNRFPRKRKYKQPTWINICFTCERDQELFEEISNIDKFTQVLNELCEKISSIDNKMVKLLGKFPEDLVEIQGKNDGWTRC